MPSYHLNILHQLHDSKSDPLEDGFDYVKSFQSLLMLLKDLNDLMTDSQDYGNTAITDHLIRMT